jgi:hypothetical protein
MNDQKIINVVNFRMVSLFSIIACLIGFASGVVLAPFI